MEAIEQNEPNREENLLKEIEEKIIIPGHTAWGHGTPLKETADKILETGITGNIAYSLPEMAVQLSSSDSKTQENSELILGSVKNWPHKNCKFVVLIEIPNDYRSTQLTETFFDEQYGRERSRLPARFIRGYVDVENFQFVENALFQENAEPAETQSEEGLLRRPIKEGSGSPIPSADNKNTEEGDIW